MFISLNARLHLPLRFVIAEADAKLVQGKWGIKKKGVFEGVKKGKKETRGNKRKLLQETKGNKNHLNNAKTATNILQG